MDSHYGWTRARLGDDGVDIVYDHVQRFARRLSDKVLESLSPEDRWSDFGSIDGQSHLVNTYDELKPCYTAPRAGLKFEAEG